MGYIYTLKVNADDFGKIISNDPMERLRITVRLDDGQHPYNIGDEVTFVNRDDLNKTATVVFTHADRFKKEYYKSSLFWALGLNEFCEDVIIPGGNFVPLKVEPDRMPGARRVDLREPKAGLEVGAAVLYLGFVKKKYTGDVEPRRVVKKSVWDMSKYYTTEQIEAAKGWVVPGWKEVKETSGLEERTEVRA